MTNETNQSNDDGEKEIQPRGESVQTNSQNVVVHQQKQQPTVPTANDMQQHNEIHHSDNKHAEAPEQNDLCKNDETYKLTRGEFAEVLSHANNMKKKCSTSFFMQRLPEVGNFDLNMLIKTLSDGLKVSTDRECKFFLNK